MATKRKISELPACYDFVGLWTIGVDKFNKSVKVSLEFVADKINTLIKSVNDTIAKSETATSSANKAAGLANTAASKADSSRTEVEKVKTETITAKDNAITATTEANKAKDAANIATKTANDAAADAKASVDKAIADLNALIGRMTPSAMELIYPDKITAGNVRLQKIQAILSPSGVANNILFIAHNEEVMHIMPDGTIVPRGKGKCKVYVIPTDNTSLYKAIEIEITARGVRMAKAKSVRLLANGNIKFN